MEEEQLRLRLDEQRRRKLAGPSRQESAHPVAQPKLVLEPIERDLFEVLLQQPESLPAVLDAIQVTQLKSATARQLLQLFAANADSEMQPGFDSLLLSTDDPALKNLLVELDEAGRRKTGIDAEVALRELLQTFARRQTEEQLLRQQAALENDELDEQQQLDMLLEILRKRQQMIDS